MRMIVKSMMFKNQSSSTGERKVEKEGVLFKEQGNSHFKRRELHQSLHCYSKVTWCVLKFTKRIDPLSGRIHLTLVFT